MIRRLFHLLAAALLPAAAIAQQGLERHDFFYAGESMRQRMFRVEQGAVTWHYDNPEGRGEISDAILLTDGNILIAHQYGIAEITPDGTPRWSYPAAEGTEIHTIQPIGRDRVLFVENGHPARVVVLTIPDCREEYAFELPASSGVHGQFRNARLTTRGTLLVANMGLGYVAEYAVQGTELCRWEVKAPWSVCELEKEHILITARGSVQEVDRKGNCYWSLDPAAVGVTSPQKSVRLRNGNTLISNWWNEWNKTPVDLANPPVQAVEVDPDGQVVWRLAAWSDPDLGPSTTIQPLDQAVNRDRLFFGAFNGRTPRLMLGPNEPVGEGRGIHPGRVAWVHNPGVATWDGRTGLWVEDRWNDQSKADALVREAVVALTGEATPAAAWEALFRHFNREHGRGDRGYRPGEQLAVKLNMNNALTHRDTVELNSSPFTTLALVRSLVRDGGMREADIVICEPSRAITDSIYCKVHREFPAVRFVDNIGGDGRERCEYYPEQIVYSEDNGPMARGLAKCIVDADYLINSALLKTHAGPGVTLTAKNWYGATDIALAWRQNAHNNFSPDKRHGKPGYKTFVDFVAHKDLGQKTLLFLIDGTYGSRDVNGAPAPKWQKEPFNNAWCCSLIVSQDGLACDAVAMDLLIYEWPEFGSLNFCDEYLREAATLPHPVSGTVYRQGGVPVERPLGLAEHWNNGTERRYKQLDLVYREL